MFHKGRLVLIFMLRLSHLWLFLVWKVRREVVLGSKVQGLYTFTIILRRGSSALLSCWLTHSDPFMALLSNSSVSGWLQFNGTDLGLTPCQYVNYTGHLDYLDGGGAAINSLPDITPMSCAQVCNDSASIFSPHTNNLATCGLWSSLLSAYTAFGPNNSLSPNGNRDSTDLFDRFNEVGLGADVIEYATSFADIISTCFQLLYYNAKFLTYSDDGTTVAACTREVLFPLGSNTNTTSPSTEALETCLEAICSPITLNPDLAGIGVIASFLIQSGICILALVALLSLEWLALFRNERRSIHAGLVAALVDFHKVQCCFSSTIQVTALILFREAQRNSALDATAIRSSFQDFFGTSILVALATSGIIPISLTLACIGRYGRQSWYLIILSLITMALASATLVAAFVYAHDYGIPYDAYTGNMNNLYLYNDNKYNDMNTTSTTCSIRGSVGHTLYPLCGTWNLQNNAIGSSIVTGYWLWPVWAYCMMWLPTCMIRHWYDSRSNFSLPHWWSPRRISNWYPRIRKFSNEFSSCRTWTAISCVTWPLCFACQLYLFSIYFKHSVISQKWSFGQIIAVTVWVPSVVEYIYIEYNGVVEASKYRYPAPLQLTEVPKNPPGILTAHQPRRVDTGDSDTTLQAELPRYPRRVDTGKSNFSLQSADSFAPMYQERGM